MYARVLAAELRLPRLGEPLVGFQRGSKGASKDMTCLWFQVEDQLAAYEAFRRYKRHGLDAQLQYYKGGQLPQELQKWVFQLCKTNMQVRGGLSQK